MKKRLAIIIITTLLGSCLYGCNKKEAVNSTNVIESKYSFPYTGEECDQTSINNTPFMVMIKLTICSSTKRPVTSRYYL